MEMVLVKWWRINIKLDQCISHRYAKKVRIDQKIPMIYLHFILAPPMQSPKVYWHLWIGEGSNSLFPLHFTMFEVLFLLIAYLRNEFQLVIDKPIMVFIRHWPNKNCVSLPSCCRLLSGGLWTEQFCRLRIL